jgi:hypothetical protein
MPVSVRYQGIGAMSTRTNTGAEPFRKFWQYEIALYRGDELIDNGTIKGIAERIGVRKDTIYWVHDASTLGYRRADSRKDQSQAVRAVRI